MEGTVCIPRMRTAAKIVEEVQSKERSLLYGQGARRSLIWMTFWSFCGWELPGQPRMLSPPWEESGALIPSE